MRNNTHHSESAFKPFNGFWFGLAALALIVILAACGGTSTGSPPASGGTTPTATSGGGSTPTTAPSGNTVAVTITTDSSGSFAFSPAAVTIKAGTTVVWTNTTGAPHTVTSDDGKTFDSGIANPIPASGGTFKFTFNTTGSFSYHCQIHPYMKATIVVQ
ncbi:MAG TPA: plastocyanin/azurin family copper-binding protein [Ktedonobacteraceae bacterium]|nr:plastocyanin/azurin family copper-binding protein [Ktedonobacteraceae bacterium]